MRVPAGNPRRTCFTATSLPFLRPDDVPRGRPWRLAPFTPARRRRNGSRRDGGAPDHPHPPCSRCPLCPPWQNSSAPRPSVRPTRSGGPKGRQSVVPCVSAGCPRRPTPRSEGPAPKTRSPQTPFAQKAHRCRPFCDSIVPVQACLRRGAGCGRQRTTTLSNGRGPVTGGRGSRRAGPTGATAQ